MRKFLRLLVLFFALFSIGAFAGISYLSTVAKPVDASSTREIDVVIPHGSTQAQISELLQENGLINNQLVFLFASKWLGVDGQLKAGEYRLSASQSVWEIIEKLHAGEVVTHQFTIPEGYTVRQVVAKMVKEGKIEPEEAEALLKQGELVADWVPEDAASDLIEPLEGYLFPDTYTIDRETDGQKLIELMIDRFRNIWTEDRLAKLDESGLTIHQVVTIASIVEKEARVDEERPVIAGVYLNRMKINMKLDADPTVLYALGKAPGEPLYLRELDVDSPYNTYRNASLPPGPIANPGLASIDAVLNPADVPYYYFVARNDGSHVFSTTYSEHLKNVAKYQN